jgi:hypothetical protein
MDLLPVVVGVAGGVLIWCALKNKNPLDVVQFALQRKDINTARPMFATPVAGAVTGGSVPLPNGPNEGGG